MQVTAISVIGKVRDTNEDYVGYFKNSQGALIAILADGVGGNLGGDIAASMAVDFIGSAFENYHISSLVETEEWLSAIIKTANAKILQYGEQNIKYKNMATTLVVAIFFGNQYLLTHLGDSRCYRLRNNVLKQLTTDHSYVNFLIKEGALSPNDRVSDQLRNVIVKGLGVSNDANVKITKVKLIPGDVLLFCSDGLTKMVNNQVIQAVLNGNQDDQNKIKELVDIANQNGGEDNISLIIINSMGSNVL
jgi:PPM family protein phosphatase